MGCTIMETRTSNIAREACLGAGLPITTPSSTGEAGELSAGMCAVLVTLPACDCDCSFLCSCDCSCDFYLYH